MSAIYGISGLVDGFIRGREVRNGWQDRKDSKERQKRMDELTFSQDARSAEEHQRRMRVYDENASDWDRERADQDAIRKITEEGMAGYQAQQGDGSMGATQTTRSTSNAQAAPPGPVEGVAANLGIPLGATPNRFAEGMPTPEELQQRYGSKQAQPSTEPPQKVAVRAGATGRAGESASAMGAVAPQQPEFITLPRQSRAIEDELAASGNVGPRYVPNPEYKAPAAQAEAQGAGRSRADFGPPGGDPRKQSAVPVRRDGYDGSPDYEYKFGRGFIPDTQEGTKRAVAGLGRVAEKAAETLSPVKDYVMGANPPETTAKDGLASLSKGYQSNFHNGKSPRISPSQATVSGVAKAADEALATTSPATQEALQAAAVTAGPLGIKPTEKAGKEHAASFAKSFNDYYLENVAPKIMEEYLRQGDLEKATGFQEFLDRKETRAGMENWVKAAHAVTLGDYDTFAQNMLEAYNRLDYFPDGTTIVKDQSGVTYGKDGQPNGARVTFRDEESGKTWEKVYSSVDDMVREGMTLLAPEAAFEHYAAQNEASKPKAEKSTDPIEQQQTIDKRIDDAAKAIFENSAGLDGQPTIPYADARRQAQEAIMGGQGAQPQGQPVPPPIAYRPTN